MLHIVKNINHEYYESNNVNYLLLDKWFSNSENLISNADAIIITSQKEEDFKNFYDRNNEKKLKEFLTERGNNLKDLKNVEFIKKNSLKLINESKKYDLIWIDGAHGYPFITADIICSQQHTHRAVCQRGMCCPWLPQCLHIRTM